MKTANMKTAYPTTGTPAGVLGLETKEKWSGELKEEKSDKMTEERELTDEERAELDAISRIGSRNSPRGLRRMMKKLKPSVRPWDPM